MRCWTARGAQRSRAIRAACLPRRARCCGSRSSSVRAGRKGGVGIAGRGVAGEDPDEAILRFFAGVAAGAEEAGAAGEALAERLDGGIGAERAVEDVRLDGARDDVDRRGDAALAPVGAEPL